MRKLIKPVLCLLFVFSMASTVMAKESKEYLFTCYCPESCPGTITATDETVREGICAANKSHLGECAMVYLTDGTFLGMYECQDTGGHKNIKNDISIDVWTPDMAKAKELMALTQGKVIVEWVENPKG